MVSGSSAISVREILAQYIGGRHLAKKTSATSKGCRYVSWNPFGGAA